MTHKTYLVAAVISIGFAGNACAERNGSDIQSDNFHAASTYGHRNGADLASDNAQAARDRMGDDARFAEALRLYQGSRWSEAYMRFVALADGGHQEAARIAMVMLRHGREMHKARWTAAPSQVAQWERAAGTRRTCPAEIWSE